MCELIKDIRLEAHWCVPDASRMWNESMTQVDAGSVVVQQHVKSLDPGHGRKLAGAVAEAFPTSVLMFCCGETCFWRSDQLLWDSSWNLAVLKCLTPPVAAQSCSVSRLSTLTPD